MKNPIPATLVAILFASGAAMAESANKPICGDVNDSSSVSITDALLVLRKSVGQPITLSCSAYQNSINTCSEALSTCLAAPFCGNGTREETEDCETGDLNGETCVSQGFAGGTLRCASGCSYDTSGCYEDRFDASDETVIDRETGLEWEKKTNGDGVAEYEDIHDADNIYSWCFPGTTYPECRDGNNPFDGTAASIFLAQMNGGSGAPCYADHCDWRLPSIEELDAIFPPGPCAKAPCVVDPDLLPASPNAHWSSSSVSGSAPPYAWGIVPDTLLPGQYYKRADRSVRAVRQAS